MSLSLWSEPAFADVLGVFGAGARGSAMAGAGSALDDDALAVATSPAGIAFGRPSVTLGLLGVVNRLTTRLSPRPVGYDASDLGSSSPVIPYRYLLRPRPEESRDPGVSGFTVGATASLGMPWLRVGVLAFVPTSGLATQNTYYPDEREQYFSNTVHQSIYGARLSTQQTLFAAAVRPLSWLSVAGGMRFLFRTHADTSVLVPDQADTAVQYVDLRTRVGTKAGATVGAVVRALDDRMRVSATFRDELASVTQGINEIQIRGFQDTAQFPVQQPSRYVMEFLPRQAALGLAYATDQYSVAADATWNQWSRYLDDVGQRAGYHDTVSASIGGELVVQPKRARLRAGVGYRPSPVPAQTGRTNYVDNDMWLLGLGSAYDIHVNSHTLEVGLFGQLQLAVPRNAQKQRLSAYPSCVDGVTSLCDEVPDDTTQAGTGAAIPAAAGLQTGNPGFPGYSTGGWVAEAGLQLTWRYE